MTTATKTGEITLVATFRAGRRNSLWMTRREFDLGTAPLPRGWDDVRSQVFPVCFAEPGYGFPWPSITTDGAITAARQCLS